MKPTDVMTALPRSVYKADGKIYEQERDTAKYWLRNGIRIALIGLENQTDPEKEMPIRVLSYDGASYRKSLNERADARKHKLPVPPLYPVVTLILYFGDRHWNYGRSLKEIIEIPEGLEPYVSDYQIHVFEIAYLSDKAIERFNSDFRYVAELFTQKRKVREKKLDKSRLSRRKIHHAREVLELMKAMTGDNRFEELFQDESGEEGSKMFELFDIYENRGIKKGLEQAQTMIDEANARTAKANARMAEANTRAEELQRENQELKIRIAKLEAAR